MEKLIGNAVFGQSGGPTAVINSSAAGVFLTALKEECITGVFGLANGIEGILNEDFYDIGKEEEKELLLLKNTPASALGSVRYKLKDADKDDSEYRKILEVFKKYNIRYFFYSGGNDSMDTCNKVSKFMQSVGYDCRVIGVPKTIDNDLCGTDHSPGYGSAARYIATSIMEVYQDARVYKKGSVIVFEIMGRDAGWLTAASALAAAKGAGPDLIYLPEVDFDREKFLSDVKRITAENNGNCIIAASEGIHYKDGTFVADCGFKDKFGHTQLGGVGKVLMDMIKAEIPGQKARAIELSLLQRCAAHAASSVDVEEAFMAGSEAVKMAVSGLTDVFASFERSCEGGKYVMKVKPAPLSVVANAVKHVPLEWISEDGNFVTDEFVKYALPLVNGGVSPELEDGLPRFARLKKIKVAKC